MGESVAKPAFSHPRNWESKQVIKTHDRDVVGDQQVCVGWMRPTRRIGLVLILAIAMVAALTVSPAAASRGGNKGKPTRSAESADPTTTDTTTTETATLAEATSLDTYVLLDAEASATIAGTGDITVTSDYDAALALGSMYNVVDQIGARDMWRNGFTGDGIDIAVIDTGVTPVSALSDPDKIVATVDLSFEAGVPEAQYLDTNGHGTHMTGIIAGRTPGADPATATPDQFFGVAPDAGIVSVKVGDNTGAVDVSQVIAGIDWVVQHRNEGDLNIRVINLSYGIDSDQDYRIDPLAAAVENAWNHGIVVVAASGNDGWNNATGGMSNPAFDPFVIAVSASEATNWGMTIPKWASAGDYFSVDENGMRVNYWQDGFTGRLPDVVAPGAHIDSLRVPNSRVDVEHPEGYVTDSIFRGSGTSQSAAVVTGAVALLLQHRPDLTPDQVKALLRGTATKIPNWSEAYQGRGTINVVAAAKTPVPADAEQTWQRSTGLGSLEAARGTQHVILDGVVLEGEITAFGDAWDPEAWIESSVLGASWRGASWNGASWTGASWTGASWRGASWTGATWTGASWTSASWSSASWTGASWTGASWTGASWTGASWTGASWRGASWTGASWR
jgi:serine protease AprX